MKKQPIIGDIITIQGTKDDLWSSGANGKHPKLIIYPFTGKVLNVTDKGNHIAINVDGWGFSLKDTIWDYTKLYYEIY